MTQMPIPFGKAPKPAAVDAFQAYPGCDKTYAVCTTKFSNQARFGGFLRVPSAETTT